MTTSAGPETSAPAEQPQQPQRPLQPRELIEGDFIAARQSTRTGTDAQNADFWTPGRFLRWRAVGAHQVMEIGRVLLIQPTVTGLWNPIYGRDWLFGPDAIFYEPCPACQDLEKALAVAYANVRSIIVKYNRDCEHCHGRMWMPYDPLAREKSFV